MSRNLSDEIADGIVSAVIRIGIAVVAGVFLHYALWMLLAFHDHIPAAIKGIWAALTYAAESTARLIGIFIIAGLIIFWGILKYADVMAWRSALRKPDFTHELEQKDIDRRSLPTSIEEDGMRIDAIRRKRDFDTNDTRQ